MKLKHEFPNYDLALNDIIGNKVPVSSSNDSKTLSYFLCLANFKNGFDYYELDRHNNGNISFSVVTMLGLKTVVTTSVPVENEDMTYEDWNRLIMKTSMNHFAKEEYQALKNGYVKKSSNAGCMGVLAFLLALISIPLMFFIILI